MPITLTHPAAGHSMVVIHPDHEAKHRALMTAGQGEVLFLLRKFL
jgi:hypothetical protein